jgi:hypothetical protein
VRGGEFGLNDNVGEHVETGVFRIKLRSQR